MMLFLGIIEFGRVLMVQQILPMQPAKAVAMPSYRAGPSTFARRGHDLFEQCEHHLGDSSYASHHLSIQPRQ